MHDRRFAHGWPASVSTGFGRHVGETNRTGEGLGLAATSSLSSLERLSRDVGLVATILVGGAGTVCPQALRGVRITLAMHLPLSLSARWPHSWPYNFDTQNWLSTVQTGPLHVK